MTIKVRFNTNYPQRSQYEWRLLVDGVETLVNQVRLDVPSWTTDEFIEGLGQKWHLTAEASEVKVLDSAGKKIAYVK